MTAKLFFTDSRAPTTMVDIGLTILTKLKGKKGEKTARHFAEEVNRHGIAEQFGIRKHDELLMLNFFPISGKSQEEVIQLFEDVTVGKEHEIGLFFQRQVEVIQSVSQYYHYVTGVVQRLEQKDGHDNLVLIEYYDNRIHRQIFQDSEAKYHTRQGLLKNVESGRYLCYENNTLFASDEFDGSDKYLFAIIVNISINSNNETFIRHRMDPPKDKFAFMDELSNTIVIMKEGEYPVPKSASQSEKMRLIAVEPKLQIYAFQSNIPGNENLYLSTSGSNVVMKTTNGHVSEDRHLLFQFQGRESSFHMCELEQADGQTVEDLAI